MTVIFLLDYDMGLKFCKYTCLGNYFIVFDLPADFPCVADLARWAADENSGIGAETVIIIGTNETAAARVTTVRFFEPNGDEFLICGNGLLSVSRHLYDKNQCRTNYVQVYHPDGTSSAVRLRCSESDGLCEARLCYDEADAVRFIRHWTEVPRVYDLIHINFHVPGIASQIGGFLVYNGEPHLVLLDPAGSVTDPWMSVSTLDYPGGQSGFLACVGDYLNRLDRSLFPSGVNVSLAMVRDHRTFDYRTYERGLFRETLACGTGAAAVATVADHAIGSCGRRWTARPMGAASHPAFYNEAHITVRGRTIVSRPRLIFSGEAMGAFR